MLKIKAIIQKELDYYLNNSSGYILACLFSALSIWSFFSNFFIIQELSMHPFWETTAWLLLVLILGLSMRTFAEEKKQHTLEVLLTLPIKKSELILGKFFGVMLFITINLGLTLIIPVILLFLGNPALGEVIAGYFGLLLYSGCILAIGIFCSAESKNQLMALISSLIIFLIINLLGTDWATRYLGGIFTEGAFYFSPFYHLNSFRKGVIDFRDVFYFLSQIIFWLSLTWFSLCKKN